MVTTIHPVSARQRIQLLDLLRGLAIFGILMVNMQIFYQPMSVMMVDSPDGVSNADSMATAFIKFFFEGKFYVMFSLLFGYGFYIFLNKGTAEGESILPVYRRRVTFLLIFGIIHVVFIWAGDILVFYALFGFSLLLFRRVSDRGLIKWAIWLAAISTLITGILTLFIVMVSRIPTVGEEMLAGMQQNTMAMQQMVQDAAATYATGTYAEIMMVRLWEYKILLPGLIFFYPMVLAMFLLGYWAGRKGLLKNYTQHLPFFRKAAFLGAIIGIPLSILFVYTHENLQRQMPDLISTLNTFSQTFGGFFLSLFYISALVLLTARNKTGLLQKLLAPVGRMALTNYLLQSVVCTLIFNAYGFGFFGRINPLQGIILAVVIFAFQIPLSRMWLKYFQYGPMEWLWRSLTYGKKQPFLKHDQETLKTAWL